MSCFTVTSGREAEPDENVRHLDAGVHCQRRQRCSSSGSLRPGLAPRGDAGTPHVHPPGRFGVLCLFPLSDRCQSGCNVVGMCVLGCLLFVSFRTIHANQTEVECSLLTDSLYSCLLSRISLISLSLWSLLHTPVIV